MNNDLPRLIENLIRTGSVNAVDLSAHPPRVRVQMGELLSDWLPWVTARAGTSKEWNPPTIEETCVVLCPGGDPACGFVLSALFTIANPSPSNSADEHLQVYPDGARILYNHATGALSATGVKTVLIEASTKVTIDCPNTHLTGNLTVDKHLTYKGGMDNAGTGTGATITGPLTHTNGALSSNGVILHTHVHTGDSGGTTGGPR